MSLLNQNAYEVGYDKLVSSGRHPLDVTIINVEANQGVLKRGTVLAHVDIEEFNGYRVLSTEYEDAKFIVADDVNTSSEESTVSVTVYKSGTFNASALIADDDYTITSATCEKLREVGIFIE